MALMRIPSSTTRVIIAQFLKRNGGEPTCELQLPERITSLPKEIELSLAAATSTVAETSSDIHAAERVALTRIGVGRNKQSEYVEHSRVGSAFTDSQDAIR